MTTPLITLAVDDDTLAHLAALVAAHLGDSPAATAASPWMTAVEAADYLSLSMDALYRLTAAGAIPRRKPNGRLRFRRDELDAWLDDHYDGPARHT